MQSKQYARIAPILIAAALLASCNGSGLSDKQRDEVGDIAGDVAGDAVGDSDKVRELEGRIEAIEARLGM